MTSKALREELRQAEAAWTKRFGGLSVERQEHRLLALLSQAIELAEVGRMSRREVETRRRALQEFYRAQGMHP